MRASPHLLAQHRRIGRYVSERHIKDRRETLEVLDDLLAICRVEIGAVRLRSARLDRFQHGIHPQAEPLAARDHGTIGHECLERDPGDPCYARQPRGVRCSHAAGDDAVHPGMAAAGFAAQPGLRDGVLLAPCGHQAAGFGRLKSGIHGKSPKR